MSETISLGQLYSLPCDPIDRKGEMGREEFEAEYMTGSFRPVIVTNEVERWPAWKKWDFDFFRENYGSKPVIVADRLGQSKLRRKVRLRDYLNYCQFPFGNPLAQAASEHPFYLTSFSPFADHPELLDDFSQPRFIDNAYWKTFTEPRLRNWYLNNFSWVFIGPAKTWSPLHIDLFGTHAWLAQIKGRKHFLLYPPQDLPLLGNQQQDLREPDLEKNPDLAKTRPISMILEPGEVVFIPAGWAHDVISLDSSISMTFNFVHSSNFMAHLVTIIRELPLWVQRLDDEAFREALNIRWVSKGFE